MYYCRITETLTPQVLRFNNNKTCFINYAFKKAECPKSV